LTVAQAAKLINVSEPMIYICRELAATGREALCQGEMTVHAALIESLLAVPNALWYCSRGFLR